MLTFTCNIINFIESLNSQLMQLTHFQLPCSRANQVISFFVLCFHFAHMINLQIVLDMLGTEHIFVHFTASYVNFGAGTCKLYPQKHCCCCSENV